MPLPQPEGDWHITNANLLSPPELTILILAALLTSLLVQFLSQDPLNFGSSLSSVLLLTKLGMSSSRKRKSQDPSN